MSKVIFFTAPAVGHVHPTLPITAELARRGVKVIHYSGEKMRAKIEGSGAEFRPIPWDFEPVQAEKKPSITHVAIEQLRCVEQWMPSLLPEIERESADYMVCDFMYLPGWVAARALGLPLCSMHTSFALADGLLPPAALITALDIGLSLRRARMLLEIRSLSERLSKKYPVRAMRSPVDLFGRDADMSLVTTSRAFQIQGHRFDERYHFVGPCFAPRVDDGAVDLPPVDGRPLVYVSLGTIFNRDMGFFERCVEAFRDGRYQVIMSVGKDGIAAISHKRHDHIWAYSYVPQLEVLKRASLFITHGGMNSASEAISHEVPMLVAPQAADQFAVAGRVEELGVGRKISLWHRSPARLRALVDAVVMDPRARARARDLRRSFDEAGGAERAAEVLQAFGARGKKARIEASVA